jgi:integrase
MAYWFRKPNGHVFVMYMKDAKPKAIPRAQTRSLDAMTDEYIDSYTRQIALQYENKHITPDNLLVGHERLEQHLAQYLAHMKTRLKRDQNTVGAHEKALREIVFRFFLEGDKPLGNESDWPARSTKLLDWMEAQGLSFDQQIRANAALRGYYQYLTEDRVVATGVELLLRNPRRKTGDEDPDEAEDRVPLKRVVLPEEVVAFGRSEADKNLRLMALLGYFFSLRPQETFGFQAGDLIAGSAAHSFECATSMKRLGMFDRLVMDVRRQRTAAGKNRSPKAHSAGKVACFNAEAARLIIGLLQDVEDPKAPVFSFNPRHWYRRWKDGGLPGVTLKDLRRASVYWLGHYTQIELANLQKHARHKYASTTQLYMRRPGETRTDTEWKLDLDA